MLTGGIKSLIPPVTVHGDIMSPRSHQQCYHYWWKWQHASSTGCVTCLQDPKPVFLFLFKLISNLSCGTGVDCFISSHRWCTRCAVEMITFQLIESGCRHFDLIFAIDNLTVSVKSEFSNVTFCYEICLHVLIKIAKTRNARKKVSVNNYEQLAKSKQIIFCS